MKRLGSVLAAMVLASAFMQASASAAAIDREWCSEDPAFSVLGASFRITTSINSSPAAVTHILYVVEVPSNAGDVTWTTPPGEALASVTEVRIAKSGRAYDGDDSFRVSIAVTVTGPDHTAVVAHLDGPSVEPRTRGGHTNKQLKLHFDVTP